MTSSGVTTPLIASPVAPFPAASGDEAAHRYGATAAVVKEKQRLLLQPSTPTNNNNNKYDDAATLLDDEIKHHPNNQLSPSLPRNCSSAMSMATINNDTTTLQQQQHHQHQHGGTSTPKNRSPTVMDSEGSLSPSPEKVVVIDCGNLQHTEAAGRSGLDAPIIGGGNGAFHSDADDDRVPLQTTDGDGINNSSADHHQSNNNTYGSSGDLYGDAAGGGGIGGSGGDGHDDDDPQSPARDSDETDENSPGDDKPEQPLEHHLRTNQLFRRAIFSTIPVFMAYAGMITLQRSIKNRIGITDADKSRSDVFGVAVGSLYLGNLIFRLLHNILFSFLIPRQRVMLSYTLLATTHLIVALAYWVFDSKSIAWTFVAYLLSGVGIGTFESNLLSCLSPLGHATKSWAVIGIPIGFNGVAVGFYIMFAAAPDDPGLHAFPYFFIAASNLVGLIFFIYGLPYVEYESSHDNATKFKEDLCRWSEWFPRVQNYCLALAADMFCVSMFSAIVYYIYDLDDIPLWPYAQTTIPKNIFQTIYNFCSFLGDFSSRKLAYWDKHKRNPYYFLVFSVLGIVCILSKTALCAPLGMFFVMFANGSIYAHTTKHVDNVVDDRFILVALSVWLFVGDIGSYVASLIVQPLQLWIGAVPVHQGIIANVTHNMTNGTNGTHRPNLSLALASMMMNAGGNF